MTKNRKLLMELESRILRLEEQILKIIPSSTEKANEEASYKEVLDEWLNGKSS